MFFSCCNLMFSDFITWFPRQLVNGHQSSSLSRFHNSKLDRP